MSQYKVFLCHNSNDKPEVRQIKDKLRQQGIETWMDEKDIIGFDDWKKKIKENLSQINTVAVFLGSSGFGEWQKYEIKCTEEEISRRNNKLFTLKRETTPRVGLVILPSCQQTFQEIQNQYYHTPYGWLFNYHAVDLRKSKAPMQELIGAITGQPWQVDDSSREVIETQNTPLKAITGQRRQVDDSSRAVIETQNTPLKGVDYTKLRDLLAAGKWKEADYETYLVMLQAVGRKENDYIREQELLNFPCADLRTIDQLWVKYSNRCFGFSVQKEIYLRVGGKPDGEYDQEAWRKFGDRVGWRVKENWISYDEVIFDTTAPDGHLPLLRATRYTLNLFSRIETCKV